MTSKLKYVSAEDISAFFKDIFFRGNCPSCISDLVIQGLVNTSLRGVDSHGIRLMPHYVQAAKIGRINLNPKITYEQTSPTTVLVDADHTYGIYAASLAMDKAIELARKFGTGVASIKNSTHFGAAAIYALKAARENMIGISFTNSDALVLPFGARSSFLGTNPICFAAPCEGEEPFCLDMATSTISWNKLMQHRETSTALVGGWAADSEGEECYDPNIAVGLLPIGGYKGYGLALMVELLCSALTGMPFGPHISKMFPISGSKRTLGHFVMAIDIARFRDVSQFKSHVKMILDELRTQPTAKGFTNVRVAGDPEKESWKDRTINRIPVREEELTKFREIAELFGINKLKYTFL